MKPSIFTSACPGNCDSCAPAAWWWHECARSNSIVEVGPGTTKPDIYMPHTIRTDSKGNIILLEIGYGTIRRINPTTNEAIVLGKVNMKHKTWTVGWAWMDVDRTCDSFEYILLRHFE